MNPTSLSQRIGIGRLSLIYLVFTVLFVLVVGRLFQRQVIEHGKYKALAENQHFVRQTIEASRGDIYTIDYDTSEEYPLAMNVVLKTLNVVPKQIENPELTATKLIKFLPEVDYYDLIDILSSDAVYYPPLRGRIEEEEASAIADLNLPGVFLTADNYRYYPEGTLAANVVGFVNIDREGQYGIEGGFNDELRGEDGLLNAERDSSGNQIAIGERSVTPSEAGDDVVLTIDRGVQYFVEKKLKEAVESHQADSGQVVIMDPKTGDIIAMANYPTYDPNNYREFDLENFRNSNVDGIYEPGSVMKVITMAAGIDAGKITPETTYTDTGKVEIDEETIRNSENKIYGESSMTKVLQDSINTGAVYVAQRLGRNLYYKYLRNFGFLEPTGIDLAGEAKPNVRDFKDWLDIDMATMSFGQGLAVTPMQVINAVAAIANNGLMMKPRIVSETISPDGEVTYIEPEVKGQVITSETAKLVSAMMVNVVENGHGKRAGVEGYRVAGKTGTAQVARYGVYQEDEHIGNFVGFAPASDPRFVMLTKIDNPRDVEFAESSAAPLFGEIAKFLLNYYQVRPDNV